MKITPDFSISWSQTCLMLHWSLWSSSFMECHVNDFNSMKLCWSKEIHFVLVSWLQLKIIAVVVLTGGCYHVKDSDFISRHWWQPNTHCHGNFKYDNAKNSHTKLVLWQYIYITHTLTNADHIIWNCLCLMYLYKSRNSIMNRKESFCVQAV